MYILCGFLAFCVLFFLVMGLATIWFMSKRGKVLWSSLVLVALAIMVWAIIGQCSVEERTTGFKIDSSTNIVQLKSTESVQGGFFLGTGSINGSPAYLYYTEDDAGYHLNQIAAKSVSIRYLTDNSSPRIEVGHNLIEWRSLWQAGWTPSNGDPTTVIYVPEGSIYQTYIDKTASSPTALQ